MGLDFLPTAFLILDYLLKLAQKKKSKRSDSDYKKTREELCEETSVSVKTINRTLPKLKEDGVISIIKGKSLYLMNSIN